MTKSEWYDLIVREFKVSRNTAKTMFHEMLKAKDAKETHTMNSMAAALNRAGYTINKIYESKEKA